MTFLLLVVVIVATVVTDIIGDPPTYLVGLLGTAAGAFFTALGSDKGKRDAEVSATANRAEAKAVEVEHRVDEAGIRADTAETRADSAERRESEPSLHKDHDEDTT